MTSRGESSHTGARDEIEGASMVWVEGAGHMVNWEAPEALVDAIESLR